jgi:hypothetical protein
VFQKAGAQLTQAQLQTLKGAHIHIAHVGAEDPLGAGTRVGIDVGQQHAEVHVRNAMLGQGDYLLA